MPGTGAGGLAGECTRRRIRAARGGPGQGASDGRELMPGTGFVMPALWYGVPMVLVPWARDQGGVAARATHLGVAEVVGYAEVSPHQIARAAHVALQSTTMTANALNASSRLRAVDPIGTACGLVERLCDDGGCPSRCGQLSRPRGGVAAEWQTLR